jgi:hypothetical protein
MSIRFFLTAFFFLQMISGSFAQKNIFTAGFQYKPIFPSSFFSTGTKTETLNGIDFSIGQKMGYCAGMILRRGFTEKLSFETGINFVKRNFRLTITDTTFTGKSNFAIIGYEIPAQVMVFLRMSENIYMNASGGVSMDMYPSNIRTHDFYFENKSKRNSIFQFAALANLGWEYRTKSSGYFYLGASYHLPFTYFYSSSVKYIPTQDTAFMKLGGNYLTVDFRYYFHGDPVKPKIEKKKK